MKKPTSAVKLGLSSGIEIELIITIIIML